MAAVIYAYTQKSLTGTNSHAQPKTLTNISINTATIKNELRASKMLPKIKPKPIKATDYRPIEKKTYIFGLDNCQTSNEKKYIKNYEQNQPKIGYRLREKSEKMSENGYESYTKLSSITEIQETIMITKSASKSRKDSANNNDNFYQSSLHASKKTSFDSTSDISKEQFEKSISSDSQEPGTKSCQTYINYAAIQSPPSSLVTGVTLNYRNLSSYQRLMIPRSAKEPLSLKSAKIIFHNNKASEQWKRMKEMESFDEEVLNEDQNSQYRYQVSNSNITSSSYSLAKNLNCNVALPKQSYILEYFKRIRENHDSRITEVSQTNRKLKSSKGFDYIPPLNIVGNSTKIISKISNVNSNNNNESNKNSSTRNNVDNRLNSNNFINQNENQNKNTIKLPSYKSRKDILTLKILSELNPPTFKLVDRK